MTAERKDEAQTEAGVEQLQARSSEVPLSLELIMKHVASMRGINVGIERVTDPGETVINDRGKPESLGLDRVVVQLTPSPDDKYLANFWIKVYGIAGMFKTGNEEAIRAQRLVGLSGRWQKMQRAEQALRSGVPVVRRGKLQ